MIAAGIFSLSGTAVAEIGSSAVIAFVLAAIVASLTAASYSEFASIYSENGGGYLFSSRTFEHDTLVYVVGAMLFLGYTGTTAFYLATMDEWVVRFILPESLHVLPHGALRRARGPAARGPQRQRDRGERDLPAVRVRTGEGGRPPGVHRRRRRVPWTGRRRR